jgi:transposase-like protein
LYRAVDREGKTVDFRLSTRRRVAAVKAYFRKAIKIQNVPRGSSHWTHMRHRAVREMKTDGALPEDTKLRSSKYLNNMIEQAHRSGKLRIRPMFGLKRFIRASRFVAYSGDSRARRVARSFNCTRTQLTMSGPVEAWCRDTAAQPVHEGGGPATGQ